MSGFFDKISYYFNDRRLSDTFQKFWKRKETGIDGWSLVDNEDLGLSHASAGRKYDSISSSRIEVCRVKRVRVSERNEKVCDSSSFLMERITELIVGMAGWNLYSPLYHLIFSPSQDITLSSAIPSLSLTYLTPAKRATILLLDFGIF